MRSLIVEDDPEAIELGPHAISLDLLQAVYRCSSLPLHTRMRAAMAALPHEVPRLAVQALITEQDIATVLDRRIAHYQELQRANGSRQTNKLIEAEPVEAEPEIEVKPPMPRIADRRYRRF
jgi:hypothetical protein